MPHSHKIGEKCSLAGLRFEVIDVTEIAVKLKRIATENVSYDTYWFYERDFHAFTWQPAPAVWTDQHVVELRKEMIRFADREGLVFEDREGGIISAIKARIK